MPPHAHVLSASWERTVVLPALLVLLALTYLRGRGWRWSKWATWRSRLGRDWGGPGFLSGLLAIWIAMGSPLGGRDAAMLTVHMAQHLLLMTIAPPLILLSAPVVALVNGLPGPRPRRVVAHHVESCGGRRAQATHAQLTLCWLVSTATLVIWHVPAAFALAWRSGEWHLVEQVSFLAAGLFFWWPLVRSWSGAPADPSWSLVLYLFLATLPCDILSGFLVFSDRVVYPVYASPSTPSYADALADQQCAGALMWTCVTLIYLVCGAVLSTQLLSPRMSRHREVMP